MSCAHPYDEAQSEEIKYVIINRIGDKPIEESYIVVSVKCRVIIIFKEKQESRDQSE
jgi:hypothetical protein